ncbi:XK-related protein 8-like [Alosa pseudoharengus]|uniref:XK-related protein 8-like n=1 Tax=Alosa pseudoharengus TaxID=34774 RepID=UPI003F8998C1
MAASFPCTSCCSSDCILNILALVFFLSDVVSDVLAVVSFYQEQAYISMGALVFLLVGSSVLVQAFSWLWYNYRSEEERNCLDRYAYLEKYFKNRCFLGALHVCQMGVFLRLVCMMEISWRNLTSSSPLTEGIAVYLTHDLNLLYLIEAFAESAPQLTFMTAVIAHRQDVEWVTGFKTVVSLSAIALSVVLYHRSMCSLHECKTQITWTLSLLYFLWNFLLIAPRVVAVALAASVLPPGAIAIHFLFLWLALFLWVWRQKTHFMDSPTGEWLYRATVALVWYFSWFNVTKGGSRGRSIIYHAVIAADITLLLTLWWWQSHRDPSLFGMTAWGVVILEAVSYTMGVLAKVAYDKLFRPMESVTVDRMPRFEEEVSKVDDVDFSVSVLPPPLPPLTASQRRMQMLAEHFYS